MKNHCLKLFIGVGLSLYFLGMPNVLLADTGSIEVSARPLKPDVVLFATPIAVRDVTPETAIDALEKSPESMAAAWKVVVFRIERVARGEFKPLGGKQAPSAWDQAKDAAKEKNVLKLLTMDFERPDDGPREKHCLSMAVADPAASFGIIEGKTPPKQRYRISLALIQKNPESYVLVKSEKLS